MPCLNSMVVDVDITSSSGYVYSFSAVEMEAVTPTAPAAGTPRFYNILPDGRIFLRESCQLAAGPPVMHVGIGSKRAAIY